MKIKEMLLTPNKYSRPQLLLKSVLGIVIHYVANPKSTAVMNRNFFENRKDGKSGFGSAHYIIDLDGKIIRCLPDTEEAYHVGADKYKEIVNKNLNGKPNTCTLGIECTHLNNEGEMTAQTYNSLVDLTVELCKKYNLQPQKDLYLHYEITGKICHIWFVNNPKEWIKFKKTVNSHFV
jgi:N-acetylmuramoyl-L-alanine amidase